MKVKIALALAIVIANEFAKRWAHRELARFAERRAEPCEHHKGFTGLTPDGEEHCPECGAFASDAQAGRSQRAAY